MQNLQDMADKCELTSKIVAYVWIDLMKRDEAELNILTDDELKYSDEAQTIFNNILDIIDGAI